MDVYVRRVNFTTKSRSCEVLHKWIHLAVQLKRIPTHKECKCKQLCLQTGLGGEICSSRNHAYGPLASIRCQLYQCHQKKGQRALWLSWLDCAQLEKMVEDFTCYSIQRWKKPNCWLQHIVRIAKNNTWCMTTAIKLPMSRQNVLRMETSHRGKHI